MQKIVPHLWLDKNASSVVDFYMSVFPDSKIISKNVIKNTPSGDCDTLEFELMGLEFMAIGAGPEFTINPSISFSINLDDEEKVQEIWDKLVDGGQVLMPLQEYPFSKFYGWLNDKYGVSWQLIALDTVEGRPAITPSLMFTQEMAGKAEEAIDFYTSIFKNSKLNNVFRYTADQAPDKEGTLAHSEFMLEGQEFMALDSARIHEFKFNEAVSLIVKCKDQEEIDYLWEKLSFHPNSEQCGWLKDKYGVSWQISLAQMGQLLDSDAAVQKMLGMKKIIIEELKNA